MSEELWAALCLVLVIEGLLPALAPRLYQRMALSVGQTGESAVRATGLLSMLAGALLLWLLKY